MDYFRALLLGCQRSPGIAAYGYLNFFYYKTLLIRNSKNKKESSPTLMDFAFTSFGLSQHFY